MGKFGFEPVLSSSDLCCPTHRGMRVRTFDILQQKKITSPDLRVVEASNLSIQTARKKNEKSLQYSGFFTRSD